MLSNAYEDLADIYYAPKFQAEAKKAAFLRSYSDLTARYASLSPTARNFLNESIAKLYKVRLSTSDTSGRLLLLRDWAKDFDKSYTALPKAAKSSMKSAFPAVTESIEVALQLGKVIEAALD